MKKVAVIAIALGGVLAVASPATARAPKFDTDVTINFVGDQYGGAFFGKVDSQKGRCRKNRRVRVRTSDDYGNIVIGTRFTNNNGQYALPVESVATADYRAIAPEKTIRKNGKKRFVCDKGVSPTISAP